MNFVESPGFDPAAINADVEDAAAAHQQLLAAVSELNDDVVAQPSLLPGWTVGHVLAHLARNADSLRGMMEAAEAGGVASQYPGGAAQRAADIEAGASRPLDEQVGDLRKAIYQLEATWVGLTATGWAGTGNGLFAVVAIAALPLRRLRETVIHQHDLGLGYSVEDWPDRWVRIELAAMTQQWSSRRPMGATMLPDAVRTLSDKPRLAWLLGRLALDGVEPAGIF